MPRPKKNIVEKKRRGRPRKVVSQTSGVVRHQEIAPTIGNPVAKFFEKIASPLVRENMVNHPPHYQRGGLECIDVIEAVGWGFHIASCIKYLWRAGKKNQITEIEDLKKARFYLDRKINLLELEKEPQ